MVDKRAANQINQEGRGMDDITYTERYQAYDRRSNRTQTFFVTAIGHISGTELSRAGFIPVAYPPPITGTCGNRAGQGRDLPWFPVSVLA